MIKDPRVDQTDNEEYMDLMERYYAKTGQMFYEGHHIADMKPEWHYMSGVTPENIEKARDHSEMRGQLSLNEQN
jgi:hypothetical protein